jgi:hypothetical protein
MFCFEKESLSAITFLMLLSSKSVNSKSVGIITLAVVFLGAEILLAASTSDFIILSLGPLPEMPLRLTPSSEATFLARGLAKTLSPCF